MSRVEFTQEEMASHIRHLLGPCELCDSIRDALKERYKLIEELNEAREDLFDQVDENIVQEEKYNTVLAAMLAAIKEVEDDIASGDSGIMNSTREAVRKARNVYDENKEKK